MSESIESAREQIDTKVEELSDWRGQTLARIRALFHEADPDVVEEIKWVKPSNPGGVAVWSHGGMICTGEIYKDKVKFTFAKGASLEDPTALFNSSLEGNARRALDMFQGDEVNAEALKSIFRAAVQLNLSAKVTKKRSD